MFEQRADILGSGFLPAITIEHGIVLEIFGKSVVRKFRIEETVCLVDRLPVIAIRRRVEIEGKGRAWLGEALSAKNSKQPIRSQVISLVIPCASFNKDTSWFVRVKFKSLLIRDSFSALRMYS